MKAQNNPAVASPVERQGRPDVRQDLLSDAEFERNCAHYADWAFYTPPEQFLFHHYDESPDDMRVCHRPMIGMEKYVVNGVNGGNYGIYDTRDVTRYLKNGTWVEIDSERFFAEREVMDAKAKLKDAETRLAGITA